MSTVVKYWNTCTKNTLSLLKNYVNVSFGEILNLRTKYIIHGYYNIHLIASYFLKIKTTSNIHILVGILLIRWVNISVKQRSG